VKGQLEGPPAQLAKMKDWLSKTGNQLITLHNLFGVSHFPRTILQLCFITFFIFLSGIFTEPVSLLFRVSFSTVFVFQLFEQIYLLQRSATP
jgi:hypothetical protein